MSRWLAQRTLYVAHRGGDANWPEGSAAAYAQATAWNRNLALEVPVWRTADGVWVVSEQPTTGRVFGTDLDIRDAQAAAGGRHRNRCSEVSGSALFEHVPAFVVDKLTPLDQFEQQRKGMAAVGQ